MIAVIGSTGRLGRALVPLLDGAKVRVLTRERARADGLPASVEVIVGDVRDEAARASAVRGCATVVSAMHGFAGPGRISPESIDRDANRALIAAARAARVGHFVLVSVQGATADHPMSLHRAKFAAEQALRESGLHFTIIRPTAFLETWTTIIGGPLEGKGRALVLGPGRNPINFVSVAEVARLVAHAVLNGGLDRDTVEIGGPENLSFVALAQRLIDARGGVGTIQHIPLPVLRAMSVLARPFSPSFARQARAAVVMNTIDMTFAAGPLRP
jgi:NADH dehydrogenase